MPVAHDHWACCGKRLEMQLAWLKNAVESFASSDVDDRGIVQFCQGRGQLQLNICPQALKNVVQDEPARLDQEEIRQPQARLILL